MTQDLFFYESGYFDPDLGYYVYTADAEAALSSQASMTATVGVIKQAEVSLTVTTSVTATISHIEGADLFAFSEAQLSAQVDRLRDNNIAVSSVFSAATDASRIIHVSADDMSTASVFVGNNIRVRYSEAAVDAAFSLTADIEMVPGGEVIEANGSWSAQFDIECHAHKKANIIDVDTSSEFTLTGTVDRIRFGELDAEAQFFIAPNAVKTTDTSSALSSTATQSTTVNRSASLTSAMNLTASMTAVISHIEGADLQAFSNASLEASANRYRSTPASLTATATQTASLNKTQQGASALSAQFAQSTIATKSKITDASLSATTALSVPYVSFANKRPHSAWKNGSGSGITTAEKRFGAGSFYQNDNTGSSTVGLYIPTTGQQNISDSENFYISAWMKFTDLTVTTADVIKAGAWSLGFINSAGQAVASVTYNGSSVLTVPYSLGNGVIGNSWAKWEFYRSGSTLTLKYTIQGGSTVTATTTFSGAITSAQNYVYVFSPNSATNVPMYLDEFFFAKGISSVQSTKDTGEIWDGGLDTTQWLYHFNTDFQDEDFGAIKVAAALTSQASVSATATTAKNASSALSSTASQSTTAVKTAEGNIELVANAGEVIVNGRIRAEVADLDSAFELSATANKFNTTAIELSAEASLSATGLRIQKSAVALSSTASTSATLVTTKRFASMMTCNASVVAGLVTIKEFSSTQNALFAPSINCVATKSGETLMQSAFSVVANNTRTRKTSSDLTVTASQTATADVVKAVPIAMSSEFTQSVTPKKLNGTSIAVSAEATQATTVVKTTDTSSAFETTASLTADNARTRTTSSALSSTATQSTTAIKSAEANISLSSASSLTANATYTPLIDLHFEAIATELTAAAKTGNTLVTLETQATVTVTAGLIKYYDKAPGATSSLVQLTNSGSLGAVNTGTWISFWARNPYSKTQQTYLLNSNRTATMGDRNQFILSQENNAFKWTAYDWNGTQGSAYVNLHWTNAVPSDTDWHHFALYVSTYSPAVPTQFTIKLFVDGESLGSQTVTNPTNNGSQIPYGLDSFIYSPIDVAVDSTTMTQFWWGHITGGTPDAVPTGFYNNGYVPIPSSGVVDGQTPLFYSALDYTTDYPVKGISAKATLTAQAEVKVITGSNMAAQASMSCDAIKIPYAQSDMQVNASLTASISRRRPASATISTQATLYADVTNQTISAQASLALTASFNAVIGYLQKAQASLAVTSTLVVNSGNLVQGSANLQAFDFVLASGRTIKFDPYLTLKIKPEERALIIKQETRAILIIQETRVNKIKG